MTWVNYPHILMTMTVDLPSQISSRQTYVQGFGAVDDCSKLYSDCKLSDT